MIKRILALLHARNTEYIRDRASLSWSILFPLLLVLALAVVFSGGQPPMFKVAVYGDSGPPAEGRPSKDVHPFFDTRFIHFFKTDNLEKAIRDIGRHKVDLLVDFTGEPGRYWVNDSSPKGYIIERVLLSSADEDLERRTARGRQIRYVDWLIPGILGMNMMFSCLFGIGYVIVHYRKTGYLKRISATPISAFEFLTAQVGSRLLITLFTSTIVFTGARLFIDFPMRGSYFNLILIAVLGSFALCSLGLTFAARGASEEVASGVINLAVWPMMLLSGVWFSLEGSPGFIRTVARFLPLTHVVDAARKIMLDGAGLTDLAGHIAALILMSLLFLSIGSAMFKWTRN